MSNVEHRLFEDKVRQTARELWPRAAAGGAINVDGRERDGLFDEGEIIHIVEATVSRKLQKSKDDMSKSIDLVKKLRRTYQEKNFKIWLVTKYEPTADQKGLIESARKRAKCPVEIIDLKHFSLKLVDSLGYLRARENYAFGSIRNPEDESDINVPPKDFIPTDYTDRSSGKVYEIGDIERRIITEMKTKIVITGDYGSGKSMTARKIYYELRDSYMKSRIQKFPVYMNLRDHFGQSDPAEALIRHATLIGIQNPNQLVAGWRAGYIFIFLDGFDEVSSSRLVKGTEKIKKARRQAVRLVRAFIEQAPKESGLLVAGREHYFDSYKEMITALALDDSFLHISLGEFTQIQIEKYLSHRGIKEHIPDWLPSRPLLLGYLATKDLLTINSALFSDLSQEEGWNYILDRVCEREAKQIDQELIEPYLVRLFMERLATRARDTESRRGPITVQEMSGIFEIVFDMPPDEKAETLIFRLPGLTASTMGDSSREFIDDDFVDACRSGDLLRFINDPYDGKLSELSELDNQVGALACRMTATSLIKEEATSKKVSASLHRAATDLGSRALCIDITRVLQELDFDYVGKQIYIRDGFFDELEVYQSPNLGRISFEQVYIGKMYIDVNLLAENGPKFRGCYVEEMEGPTSSTDFPNGVFDDETEIGTFIHHADTNAEILSLDIPLSIRVLLTILKKLFFQPGGGRKENAFYRGLDTNARGYVTDILDILSSSGFAAPYRINGPKVWVPNRSKSEQAKDIVNSPQTSMHPVLRKIKDL